MSFHQFLLALRGRLWVFLSLLAATFTAAVVVTLVLPKSYDATVLLLMDARDEQNLSGTAQSARNILGYMQTQIDIIQSQRVARRVAQALKLGESEQARAAFEEAGSPGTIEDWIGSGLLAKLKVDSSQSSVVSVKYTASDPTFAAQVANAFAQAYLDVALNLRVEPTRQAAGFFDDQLKLLRKDLEKAQDRLTAFQREKGIIATDERIDVENARLNELSTQALQAQAATFEAQSRSGMSSRSGSPETLPEVLANPVIQSLKTEMLRAEAKLAELSTRLGPNHPQYRQQAAEVSGLRAKLRDEMRRVQAGVSNLTAQNAARQSALQKALDAQRRRVIELRDARAEAFVLQRDVDTAQKAYEAALARYLVNKVESGARAANVSILNPATEPVKPSRPRVLVNLVLGLMVGTFLGLGAVFLMELLDRRVRSSEDLESGLDAPLLGTLQPWYPSRLLGGPGGSTKALPSPV